MGERESIIDNPESSFIYLAIGFAVMIVEHILTGNESLGIIITAGGFYDFTNAYFINSKKRIINPKYEYNKFLVLLILVEIVLMFYVNYR